MPDGASRLNEPARNEQSQDAGADENLEELRVKEALHVFGERRIFLRLTGDEASTSG